MKARYFLFCGGLFCLLLACNSGPWLAEQAFGEAAKWKVDQPVSFSYENPAASEKNLVLDMAFLAEYPYQNIWFKLETTDPQGQITEMIFGDTLMNVDGTWIGKQDVGNSLDWLIQPQPRLSLSEAGTYQFKLSQHMREEALEGVQSLRVNLE
ncbi:MAG: hypothetical protein AAF927_05785 [Bacteroidota bacterium]